MRQILRSLKKRTSLLDEVRSGELGPAVLAFQRGFVAGVAETLDQLEGRSLTAPDGVYRGPVPDELLKWLADVRRRVDAERAKDGSQDA